MHLLRSHSLLIRRKPGTHAGGNTTELTVFHADFHFGLNSGYFGMRGEMLRYPAIGLRRS